jgi:hypothetical protein
MNSSSRKDALAAIVMLLVAVPFAATTRDIFIDPLDPGFSAQDFPIGVLGAIAVMSGTLLFNSLRAMRREGISLYEPGEIGPIFSYVVPMTAIAFVYIWLIELFQYPAPTFLVAAASLAMFGNRGWRRLLFAPLIATLVYYVLFFGLLGLNEAPGLLWEFDNQVYFRPLRNALGLF